MADGLVEDGDAQPVLVRFEAIEDGPAIRLQGKLLAERSGGKLGVKVFPNGALGSEKDTIEQLKIGGLDMMRINVAPLNNVVPETIVPALPFIFRSEDHMHAVLDGPVGDEILGAMERQGMVGLAFYDSGARSIYTARRPINSYTTELHCTTYNHLQNTY